MDKAHHSFTRSAYDECELKKQFAENMASFQWATDCNVVESKESCFQGSAPFMHNPFKSIPKESVDIESELKGQTRNLSRCPEHKFDPSKFKPINITLNECKDNKLVPEYTRENRSCNVLSGISINRFNPLCDDSYLTIHQNDYIGKNTRLEVKDTYTKKREEQKQIDKRINFDVVHLKDFCKAGGQECSFIELKKRE
jgi:hypothetical protein